MMNGLRPAGKQERRGLPLVDAGMRQLNTTGWMHNRLRMVTSQFLAKHLFINWREGERYFMRNLQTVIWQRTMAVGNGALQRAPMPYPTSACSTPSVRAERFDPTGAFVR